MPNPKRVVKMVTFDIYYSGLCKKTNIFYNLKEYSFGYHTAERTDASYLIDCLQINIDTKSRVVCGLSGFHAYTMWRKSEIFYPCAAKGELRIHEACETGTIKRIMENVTTYFNPASQVVCIGTPNLNGCVTVQFLQNTTAALREGVLSSLWIQPIIK